MKRLEEYDAAGLAAIGQEAFWNAIAEACPAIRSGDMAPGEDSGWQRESVDVVRTWLRNNVPDTPPRWTIVVEAPNRLSEGATVTVQGIELDIAEMLNVVEIHHEDMLERGS